MSWNFRVRHYADEARQARDWKYEAGQGVLYPRAAALGGCTRAQRDDLHAAARLRLEPHRAAHRRPFLARVAHAPATRGASRTAGTGRCGAALRHVGLDPTGHGWGGWLRTEKSIPLSVLGDDGWCACCATPRGVFAGSLPTPLRSTLRWLRGGLGDPNARRLRPGSFEGLCYTPLSTADHRRAGVRERLLEVAARHPGRLHIELDALATRVLFDADGAACGVEYLKGARLYRAHAAPSDARGRAARGAGAARGDPLRRRLQHAAAADAVGHRPGRGTAPARHRAARRPARRRPQPAGPLRGRASRTACASPGRCWKARASTATTRCGGTGRKARAGMYASNGAALGVVSARAPRAAGPEPDLFCMALLARFEGYFPGFSKLDPRPARTS